MVSKHAKSIPIFWGHGSADPLVKYQLCKDSVDFLVNRLGISQPSSSSERKGLSFKIYEGVGHTTNQEELDDLRSWIKRAIPESGVSASSS